MITQDDVVYFIITDRFFNGDKNNDDNINVGSPRRFHGGDLKGIIDKLDYIKKLGATAIWITPVYQNTDGDLNDNPYHYYWPKDFYNVDKHLYSGASGLDYFKQFVQTCHNKGIKVVLDVIVNHVGPGVSSTDFNGALTFNGYFSNLPVVNLEQTNCVDYFINNLIFWIEQSEIDGLRMDMAKDVPAKFWYYYKSIIKGKFPNLFIVGEVLDTWDIKSNSKFQNSYDLNSIFDFPLAQAIVDVFIKNQDFSVRIARKRLNDNEPQGTLDCDDASQGGYYTNANRLLTHNDMHDTYRIMSCARQFYPGNGQGKKDSYKIVEMCYAFQMTVRGIPLIYYGSEIGLEGWLDNPANNNNHDSDLRRDFPWEKIDNDYNVKADSAFDLERNLLNSIRKLIDLRKGSLAIKYGVTLTLWSDNFVYAFLTYCQNEIVIAIFNNGYGRMLYPLDIPILRISSKEQQVIPDRIIDLLEKNGLTSFVNSNEKYTVKNNALSVLLDGKSYKILKNT